MVARSEALSLFSPARPIALFFAIVLAARAPENLLSQLGFAARAIAIAIKYFCSVLLQVKKLLDFQRLPQERSRLIG
jgi:hypothetical protein